MLRGIITLVNQRKLDNTQIQVVSHSKVTADTPNTFSLY